MGHDILPEHLPEVTEHFISFLRQLSPRPKGQG